MGKNTEVLAKQWAVSRAARLKDSRECYGQAFQHFDEFGFPVFGDRPTPRTLRGPELVRALERALATTGDPVFDDALRAVRAYRLDQGGGAKQASREVWGVPDADYLVQVRYLHERGRRPLSIRAASERVVAEFGVDGPSFEAASDRIRFRFSKWKRSGYPPSEGNPNIGDLGYAVFVTPKEGLRVVTPGLESVPPAGVAQPATNYWRRRYRDGDVTLRFLGEDY